MSELEHIWRQRTEEQARHADRYRQERDALQKFKAYVHQRLDEAGVPKDPESPHKAEGCRIGGRLDYLIKDRDSFRTDAMTMACAQRRADRAEAACAQMREALEKVLYDASRGHPLSEEVLRLMRAALSQPGGEG